MLESCDFLPPPSCDASAFEQPCCGDRVGRAGWWVSQWPGAGAGISYAILALAALLAFGATSRFKSVISAFDLVANTSGTFAESYLGLPAGVDFAGNPLETVAGLIRSWKPQGCRTHKQYQNSLSANLVDHLPYVKVTQESGGSRVRADIEVGKAVVIELKVDFDNTLKLQRLLGQIELYKREFPGRSILTVFVGHTDRNTLQTFEEAVAHGDKVGVIRK